MRDGARAMTCADVWEAIARRTPGADAVIRGDVVLSWSRYDDRAGRLATHLVDAGLAPGSTVGLLMYNCLEYLEAHYAALKIRAVPINVNYRYLATELQHVLDDAACEAVIVHGSLAPRLAAIADELPRLRRIIEVAEERDQRAATFERYDDVVAASEPIEHSTDRRPDDRYMLYTGGTTGLPKGVAYENGTMTRFFVNAMTRRADLPVPDDVDALADTAAALVDDGTSPRSIPCCPLMHGTGIWLGAMGPQLLGGAVIVTPSGRFDPREVWSSVDQHGADSIVIVGDVFARPLLAEFDRARESGEGYDASTLSTITSSGAMFSLETKQQLIERLPQVVIRDVLGSSEGAMGSMVTTAADLGAGTARFVPNPGVVVIDGDDRPVRPGSGDIGVVASSGGNPPIGYHNDPDKSAATFRFIDGIRHTIHGDMASVELDGSITLLGRGSHCINTGGEKVFPEEVEEALKTIDGVTDALVFGENDERFGQRVAAVASVEAPNVVRAIDLMEHVRSTLSSYKVPRRIEMVDRVPRHANGKADYAAARALADSAR